MTLKILYLVNLELATFLNIVSLVHQGSWWCTRHLHGAQGTLELVHKDKVPTDRQMETDDEPDF